MPNPQQQHVRALLESGLRAVANGDIPAGASAFQQALQLAPEDPVALKLMGTALLQLEHLEEAADCLQRAAQKLRNDPAVHGNLAQTWFALGRYEQARESFRKASRLDPRAAHLQLGIANSLAMQGRYGDAEVLLRKQTTRFPNDAYVWHNLGNVLRDLGRPADAVDSYRKALALDADLLDARNNMGGALHALLQYEEAEREYRACIAAAPDYALARCNLASLLIDQGRFSEAEAECRAVIRQVPDLRIAHTFLGAALGHQNRHQEALSCHRAAMAIAPDEPAVIELYAAALVESGAITEGLRLLNRALVLNPESRSGHQLLGNALLAHGHLGDGWTEYRHRPAFFECSARHPVLTLAQTLPPMQKGRHIVLLSEQGLGDELFFLRYAPLLSATGARTTYRPGSKIRTLVQRAGCMDALLDADAPLPPADAVMMLGDLPHALGHHALSPLPHTPAQEVMTGVRDFPLCIGVYWPPVPPSITLTPLPEKMTAMRERLALCGEPPYLGLTWNAGTPPLAQRDQASWVLHKQIAIAPFAASLSNFPGTCIALQRNPGAGEIDLFSRELGKQVHDFTDLNDDLEAMLALLALIDEYAGVSNTNMHLRAAVGLTAHVLVPCPAEWRWMASGTSSPWFPGFQIYRQSLQGHWDTALAALGARLSKSAR